MKKDMEWYVLNYDVNRRKIYNFNIFNHWKFCEEVDRLLAEFNTDRDFNKFCSGLDSELKYYFRYRREYEISVGDAFEENLDRYEKYDVYSQLYPNLTALAYYIIHNS